MRIAMVASECEPFAKTGGLADVVDALSRALGRAGHSVDVYLPRYRSLSHVPIDLVPREVVVPVGVDPALGARGESGRRVTVTVWTGTADGYRLRLVEHDPAFAREGFYGGPEGDYPDNGMRFTLLGRAALETIRAEARPVDILHGHDWQAGPAVLSLRTRYAFDPLMARAATVMTCHNLAYHGWIPRERAWALDLPDGIGDHYGVDLLRESVRIADLVNTVSPTYAEESLTPEYGGGLDETLRQRGDRYSGILNGIDTSLWDPATDPALPAVYSAHDLAGKARCREDLAARHGLDAGGPIFGLVGRLDPQKGFDLVAAGAARIVEAGARLIILGTGDARLVESIHGLAAERPDRVVVLDRFDRDEARRIYAGADAFLMPSRFEPSGQGQLIALRYGTVPIVRLTGGLADTIVDADVDAEDGNGFGFLPADPAAFVETSQRAIAAWNDPARWAAIQRRGMLADPSWAGPAARYEQLYRRALELRASTEA
ncbi:MAG: glycogen/starch synthase [Chloroflexota bacterium]